MINEIVMYEVNKVMFNTRLEAEAYLDLLDLATLAEKFIRKNDNYNQPGGVPNSQENINKFNEVFRLILVRHLPDLVGLWDSNKRGIIGRYLSDNGSPIGKVINSLYHNCVLCVGSDNKTYGQPYFALNAFS